jgi:hypothetical protein
MGLVSECQYPGLGPFYTAFYCNSQGVAPGRAIITAPASPAAPLALAPIGDLTLSDGTTAVLATRCRVASVTFSVNEGKVTAIIALDDRRWEWYETGQVSGRYNVPAEYRRTVPLADDPNFAPPGNQNFTQVPVPPGEEPIRPETAKSARQLCELCLKAMGCQSYDVSAVDDKAYPSVEWDAERPALALQALAERFGCRVVYRNDTDSLVLCKQGVGAPLPDGPLLMDSVGLTVKALPKKVSLLTAPIKYQVRLALEAVGFDFDGVWRPINLLSYAPQPGTPTGGWETVCGPPSVELPATVKLPGSRTLIDAQELARAYVYRAYRVALTRAEGMEVLRIPPDGKEKDKEKDRIDYHKQVILLPNQVEVGKDDLKRRSPRPAQVFGRYSVLRGANNMAAEYYKTTKQTELRVPFSIDAEHAIIIFSNYVYAWKQVDDAGTPNSGKDLDPKLTKFAAFPAELVLQTAVMVADRDTWQLRRKEFSRDVPGGVGDTPRYVVREEVLYAEGATYADDNSINTTWNNRPEVQPRVDFYLAGEVLKLVPDESKGRAYCGIRNDVFPDGAIQQVTWEVGGGSNDKPCTVASRNTEHSVYLGNYARRRQQEDGDLSEGDRSRERRAAAERAAREFVGPPRPGGVA